MSDGTDRQYFPVWSKLKSLPAKEAAVRGVSITTPRPLHKRIAKAVRKEKWLDIGYKINIEPKHAIMYTARSGSILTFFLRIFDNETAAKNFTVDDF